MFELRVPSWSLGGVPILLRNKRCCVAQQRGGWLRKAAGGGRKLQGRKCTPLA